MSHLGTQSVDGQGTILRLRQRPTPPLSEPSESRVYTDGTQLLQSVNGGPYVPIGSGAGSGDQVKVEYVNGNAGTISLGQATATSSSNSVDLATALADDELARVIGFVCDIAGIAPAAAGDIVVAGRADALFVSGLTLSPMDEVFLSLTSGSLTNDATAFGTGNVLVSAGFVKSLTPINGGSPYDGAGNLVAQIQIQWGQKLVL